MTIRDYSPIEQQWVQRYCDELLCVARKLPPQGWAREAALRRVECAMALLEAWQRRERPGA